jgi:hypothetical protein
MVWRALAICSLVLACAPAPPLEGIDLPPASLPDEFEDSIWAVEFSSGFEPGFWEEGAHSYSLHLDCPVALDEAIDTDLIQFESNSTVNLFSTPIYLRLVGLADNQTGPGNMSSINPEQLTIAIVTIIGIEEEDADAAADGCEGEIRFDDGGSATLAAGRPVRP